MVQLCVNGTPKLMIVKEVVPILEGLQAKEACCTLCILTSVRICIFNRLEPFCQEPFFYHLDTLINWTHVGNTGPSSLFLREGLVV